MEKGVKKFKEHGFSKLPLSPDRNQEEWTKTKMLVPKVSASKKAVKPTTDVVITVRGGVAEAYVRVHPRTRRPALINGRTPTITIYDDDNHIETYGEHQNIDLRAYGSAEATPCHDQR